MTDRNKQLSEKCKIKWKDLKNTSNNLYYFFNRLELSGDVCLFGGAVRDWWLDLEPKDYDIVINLRSGSLKEELNYLSDKEILDNQFGNSKIKVDGLSFDLWELKDTLHFGLNGLDFAFENLPKIVPYNYQSVVWLTKGEVYQDHFWSGIDSKKLEFVSTKNMMDGRFIASKALAFRKKYGIDLSDEVIKFVVDNLDSNDADLLEINL